MTSKTYIIAEAGVNHNGSLDCALRLVECAAQAGASAVKFQTFQPEEMVSKHAKKAPYQLTATSPSESQYHMLKRLVLDEKAHHRLLAHCNDLNIEFLSTPFDFKSVDFLVNEMGLKTIKISSGDLTNAPLLLKASQMGCQLILSTGMAMLSEVEQALSVVAFGYSHQTQTPTLSDFCEAYCSPQGQNSLKTNVRILHCTSAYPTPFDAVNLKSMASLQHAFHLPVGLSDHTMGIEISIAAVAQGATIIEKHFTLDKTMQGPDHRASLEPQELNALVQSIRHVEMALGDGLKAPQQHEIENRQLARKSIVAAKSIIKGEIILQEHLALKRPNSGADPLQYWSYLNTTATRNYDTDEPLDIF